MNRKSLLAVLVWAALQGCASRPMHCDGELQPINMPSASDSTARAPTRNDPAQKP